MSDKQKNFIFDLKPNHIMQFSKKEKILILLSGILFLVLYGICSYFNRFAVDDYHYISNIREQGVFGNMWYDYQHWGGRWAVNILWAPLYMFYKNSWTLTTSSFLLMVIFLIAVYIAIYRIQRILDFNTNKKQSLILALFFVQFIFIITPEKGEIFFWSASAYTYFLPISCFIIACSIFFSENKIYLWQSFIIILCFIYTGGASEAYALNCLLFLITLLFFIKLTKQLHSAIFKKIVRKRLIFYSGFLLFSFLVSAFSPGNAERMKGLPEPGIISGFIFSMKTLYHLGIKHFIPLLHYIALFMLPWLYVGYHLAQKKIEFSFIHALRNLLLSLLFMTGISIILIFPTCYSLSDVAPDRALLLLTIVWAIYFCFIAFRMGQYRIFANEQIKKIFLFFLIICSLNSFVMLLIQYPVVSNYAKSLDERERFLISMEKSGNKKTISLNKLQPSGFLYSSEITDDSSHYRNMHYMRGVGINFPIKLGRK